MQSVQQIVPVDKIKNIRDLVKANGTNFGRRASFKASNFGGMLVTWRYRIHVQSRIRKTGKKILLNS